MLSVLNTNYRAIQLSKHSRYQRGHIFKTIGNKLTTSQLQDNVKLG